MDTLVFTIARMNPPTPGHLVLIQKLIETACKLDVDHVYIILSKTVGNEENPISCDDKVDILGQPQTNQDTDIMSGLISSVIQEMIRARNNEDQDLEEIKKISRMKVVAVCVPNIDRATPFTVLGELINFKKELGIFGSIFLVGLGIFYLFFKKYHSKEDIDKGIKINSTTHIKLFITGFLINTLNPSVIGLWLAASTKSIGQPLNEKIAIFSICLTINILADIAKINLAGKLKKSLTERNIHYINIISGILFIAFGIVLIVSVLYNSTK
jgi:hypothetical protein